MYACGKTQSRSETSNADDVALFCWYHAPTPALPRSGCWDMVADTICNKLSTLDERMVQIYMGLYTAYGANAAFYTSIVLELCRQPPSEVVSVPVCLMAQIRGLAKYIRLTPLPHNPIKISESRPVTKGDSVKSLFSNLRGTMQVRP